MLGRRRVIREFCFHPNPQANEEVYAREVLERFMRRAYRRPVESAEVEQMMELFYAKIRPRSASLESAMREVLAMVLISPDFLYLRGTSQGWDAKIQARNNR